MEYKDVETTIIINDKEYWCIFSFEYQPGEPQTKNYPGIESQVTIISLVIEPAPGFTVDLFTPSYDWLMTNEMHKALEMDANTHVKESELIPA